MNVRIRHHNEEQLLLASTVVERFEAGEIPKRAEYLDQKRNDWFPIFYLVEELRQAREAEAILPVAQEASVANARAPVPTRAYAPAVPAREDDLVVEATKASGQWKAYEPVPIDAYRQYLQNRGLHHIARWLLHAFLGAGLLAQVPLAVWIARSELGWWGFPILVATTLGVVSGYFIARCLLDAADASVESGARSWSQ
ncbi:MAG: hypothetical protein ACFB20_11440 [Opitutales bacterium]